MKRKLSMSIVFIVIVGGGWFALAPVREMVAGGLKAKRGRAVTASSNPAPMAANDGTNAPYGMDSPTNAGGGANGEAFVVNQQEPRPETGPPKLSEVTVRYSQVLSYSADMTGPRSALVQAKVALGDRQGDKVYIWAVKVVNDDNKTLKSVVYKDQGFDVAAVGEMQPTFADNISIPPGTNWMQLKLFAFPTTLDPASYDRESNKKTYQVLQMSRQVTAS